MWKYALCNIMQHHTTTIMGHCIICGMQRNAALAGADVVVVQLGLAELTLPGAALEAVRVAAEDHKGR
jgi:hypothetical protein